jgi:hypothetical protein
LVDPILSDIRCETHRPAWKGYVSLSLALGTHGIQATPAVLREFFAEERASLHSVLRLTIFAALALAIPMIALPPSPVTRHSWSPLLAAYLTPGMLVLTLPAALFIAVPWTIRTRPPRHIVPWLLCVMTVQTATGFGLIGWAVPEANQAYRRSLSGNSSIPRGSSEQGLGSVRQQIQEVRMFRGGDPLARRLTFEYYQRFALATSAVPAGLLALGLARRKAKRRHLLVATGAAIAFILLPVAFSRWASSLLASHDYSPAMLAWLPNVVLGILAISLLSVRLPTIRDNG